MHNMKMTKNNKHHIDLCQLRQNSKIDKMPMLWSIDWLAFVNFDWGSNELKIHRIMSFILMQYILRTNAMKIFGKRNPLGQGF